ncbi:MAG: 5-(carboxyamino)imidazole ribonucleotide mutase [candidate division Zixibacteria bacterium]|nr:5-(carboxyamino)imidazole ribonucleotide mutase [candidate division Zixibacteria bacterium]
MADVLIILGSKSDMKYGEKCQETLNKLDISNELVVSSAHREPEKTAQLASGAREKGTKVIICMAGMSAALPGVTAAKTDLPVIGVPLSGSALMGMDSLFSVVQMPKGVPVGAVGLDKAGAENSALLAARIIALGDSGVYNKLNQYREEMLKK